MKHIVCLCLLLRFILYLQVTRIIQDIALKKAISTVDIAELIIKKMNSAEHKREQKHNGTLFVSTTPSHSLFKNSEPEWFLVDVWIFDFGRHYLR